ncbi:MAG: diacylglycerol kinase [Candidatus Omnitrophota bacterium]
MEKPKIVDSFNAAIEGFLHTLKTQRNMRIHFIIAVLVIIAGVYLNFNRIEIMILCLTITFVLVAEMFNTGIEFLLDRLVNVRDQRIKIIKDVSAGTVLIASINAVVISYFLFIKHDIFKEFSAAMFRLRQSNWHITFLALILITAIVILTKALFHKGTPLKGGMPSGHAAVSFSMSTIIAFASGNALISVLALILAMLVSQSRVRKGLHSFWEVFIGALLGCIITILVYQIFSQA